MTLGVVLLPTSLLPGLREASQSSTSRIAAVWARARISPRFTVATSIVVRRKVAVAALARWLLGLGIAATLAANVAHGLGHGLPGAVVAAWPAVALVACRARGAQAATGASG